MASCSTAPDLKVSQATMRTLYLFCKRKKHILERFVDLPTPLTPTMDMTYGRFFCRDRAEGDVTASISRRRSRDEVGVRILLSEASMADCIFVCTPGQC